jgi:hypothetical protein
MVWLGCAGNAQITPKPDDDLKINKNMNTAVQKMEDAENTYDNLHTEEQIPDGCTKKRLEEVPTY